MVTESISIDPSDPLAGYSSFSIVPRTYNLNNSSEQDDMDSLHDHFKTMALISPQKLLEQARVIVDNGFSFVASELESEDIFVRAKENLRNRRPDLGRKRARFSMKPNIIQSVSLDPIVDLDQLQDPEQYFLAHERLENANEEIERQTGSVVDLNQHNSSRPTRQRRPGIFGKPVSYKHHYPLKSSDEDMTISSQETFKEDILSPSNHSSQKLPSDINIAEQKVEASDEDATQILNELLSHKTEDLEGDGALAFLKMRLQIKKFDVSKRQLSENCDFLDGNLTVSDGNFPKPKIVFSDLQNISGVKKITRVKHEQVGQTIVDLLTSPTPPRNPYASGSLLTKRILQSNSSIDPFPTLNIDPSLDKYSSPVRGIHDQSDDIDHRKELSISGNLKRFDLEVDATDVAKISSHGVLAEDATYLFEKCLDGSFSVSHGDLCIDSSSYNVVDNGSTRPEATYNAHTIEHSQCCVSEYDTDMGGGSMNDIVNNRDSVQSDNDVQRDESSELRDPIKDVVGDYVKDMVVDNGSIGHEVDSVQTNKRSDSFNFMNDKGGDYVEDMVMNMYTSKPEADLYVQTNECSELHSKEIQEHTLEASNDWRQGKKLPLKRRRGKKTDGRKNLAGQLSHVAESNTLNGPSKTTMIDQEHPLQELSNDQSEGKKPPLKRSRGKEASKSLTGRSSCAFEPNQVDIPFKIVQQPEESALETFNENSIGGSFNGTHSGIDSSSYNVKDNGSTRPEAAFIARTNQQWCVPGNDLDMRGGFMNDIVNNGDSVQPDNDIGRNESSELHDIRRNDMVGDHMKDTVIDNGQRCEIDSVQSNERSDFLNSGDYVADMVVNTDTSKPEADSDAQTNECSELYDKEPALVVSNDQLKKPLKHSKTTEVLKRQSLADAGLKWQSGVRKSTRIKMRPLEYWKGERFLYGRVHRSMTTIIGLKYESPGKGEGRPTMRVKSYVADEFKDLVELASLH